MDSALSHSYRLQRQDRNEQRNRATIRKNIIQDYDADTLEDPESDDEGIMSEK